MTTAAQRLSTEGFGPDNLPYGSFSPAEGDPRLGVRLGDVAISLRDLVPHEPRDWRTAVEAEVAFVREEVVPLVRRRMRGEYDGDRTMPRSTSSNGT